MENSKTIPNGRYGTQPLKTGLKPDVLTDEKPTGPFSFYDPKNFKEKEVRPAVPCYIPLETLNKPQAINKTTVFQDFEEEKTGDLKLKDKNLKDKQKGVLMTVFKEAASKLIEGKGIVGLSLPVRIFEARSSIERICDLFKYSSHYLSRAAATDEPVERIKFILGFVISAVPMTLSQWKPFNPLLGETFQATFVDGTTLECEHTSHHPPISNFYVKNKHYTVYGAFTINGDIHANSIEAYNEGWATVEFADGAKFKFTLPCLYIWGLVMGSRGLQITGAICVVDEVNHLKGVVKYSADTKTGLTSYFSSSRNDMIRGAVYKYDEKKHKETLAKHDDKWMKMLKELAEQKDVVKEIARVEGSWLREVRFNGELLWTLDQDVAYFQQHMFVEDPLPSDCRFREDLVWLTRKNEELAGTWKVKLEEQQRHERALRKKVADSKGIKPAKH
jgi:hypothetical protein